MHRLTGRSGLTLGPYVTTLMLLLAPAAGTAAAESVDAAAPTDGSIASRAAALAGTAALEAGSLTQDPPPDEEEGAAAPAEPPADAGAAGFLSQLKFSGLVDGYYAWAFHEESPQLRSFDVNHNQFSLSYAEVALWKPQGGALEGTPNKWVRPGDPR